MRSQFSRVCRIIISTHLEIGVFGFISTQLPSAYEKSHRHNEVVRSYSSSAFILPYPFLILSVIVSLSSIIYGQNIIVRGRVVDNSGNPIPTATVRLYDGPGLLTLTPYPVALDGRFEISLSSFKGSHFRCEVKAPGFAPARRNIIVYNSLADAGDIIVRQALTLKLGDIKPSVSADGRYSLLEVFIHNESKEPQQVSQIELRGTAKTQTGCLDIKPAIIFDVSDTLKQTRIKDGEGNQITAIQITGILNFLPCKQIRMDLAIPSLFQLGSGERIKIRLQIPRNLRQKNGSAMKLLALEEWEAVLFTMRLSDGSSVESLLIH